MQYQLMNTKEHRRWLQQVMTEKGLNELQWAEKAGVHHNILYQYFSGKSQSISEKSREKLAPIVGLTSEQMKLGVHANGNNEPHVRGGRLSDAIHLQTRNTLLTESVPVFGPAAASSPDRILITEEYIVGYDPRPIELTGIKDGFRMYVSGNSMEPRHFHGEKVSVHPFQAPSIGMDCVIVMKEDGNAIIKRYMGQTDTHYKLMQWNPRKDLTIKKSDVQKLYAVVR